VALGWFHQNGVPSSRPPAGNASRWALGCGKKQITSIKKTYEASMSVERIKVNAATWLLLGLAIGVLIGLSINNIRIKEGPEVPVAKPTFTPGRVVDVTLDRNQQEELFAQLEKFAEKWRYAIRIRPTDLNGIFRIDMWRSDIHVGGVYDQSGGLQLAFMDTESTRPTPAEHFEAEIQDLKTFIDEIPNSTFTFWTPPAPP
jgi:hypothetical protein